MGWSKLALYAVIAGGCAAPASAGVLLGTDMTTDELVQVDTVTFERTVIGPLDVNVRFNGAAYDGATGSVYMTSGREDGAIYRVDAQTGASTLIAATGIPQLFGLEFDDSTGFLYASQFGDFLDPMSGLFRVDPTTGEATVVNPQMAHEIGSLAYDSRNDRLVGVTEGAGDFYAIDRTTGAQTLLLDGDFVNDGGLAYDRDANLFWYSEYGGNLYAYDPADGFAKTLRAIGVGDLTGLAYKYTVAAAAVPEPASWAMMIGGFGLVGGAIRRRQAGVTFA